MYRYDMLCKIFVVQIQVRKYAVDTFRTAVPFRGTNYLEFE